MKFFLLLLVLCVVKGDERGARVRRIVGGEPAVPPPEDDPVVFTRFGGRTARVLGVRDRPHYVFRGVRYAYPPVDQDRFVRPRQYYLQGFENATQFAPPCVQPVPGKEGVIGDEDCLFLNVFTPTLPTGLEGLPVVVWIHGGGFRYGSASQYGVHHLVGKQVVVVTVQYRLGSLGFLSTGTKVLPGNAALFDMALAVLWTRNYIGFFGGNPHRITVMGHGSGASSAIMVALSNIAKGLTSGVIAMSGSSLSQFASDDNPKNTAQEVADANGCPTGSELTMVRCLQNISPEAVIKIDSNIEFNRIRKGGFVAELNGKLGCAPVYEGRRDGRSLPPLVEAEPISDPETAHRKIPLLTGITKDETKRACEGQYKDEIVTQLKNVGGLLDKLLLKDIKNTLSGLPLGSILPLNVLSLDNLPLQGLPLGQLPLVGGNNQSGGLLGLLDSDLLKNYLSIEGLGLNEVLEKVGEITGDVLFSIPALLTAHGWSKQDAPSFLYSFEHAGKRKKGFSFLSGLPLVGNASQSETSSKLVSHGDELAYLFDPHDINGKPLNSDEKFTEEDDKVRDVFTQLIADFARAGQPTLNNQDVNPFSITSNNFIQIGPKPQVLNNFRFCQIGLWIGLVERLKNPLCQALQVVQKLPGTLIGPVGGGGGPLNQVTGTSRPLGFLNLGGGGRNTTGRNKGPLGILG